MGYQQFNDTYCRSHNFGIFVTVFVQGELKKTGGFKMEKYQMVDAIYVTERYPTGYVISSDREMKYLKDAYYAPPDISKQFVKGSMEIMWIHVLSCYEGVLSC